MPDVNQMTVSGLGFVTCVQHDTNKLSVFRLVRFNAAGTCKIGAVDGSTYSGTYIAGEQLAIQGNQIFDTGTSLADADICLIK